LEDEPGFAIGCPFGVIYFVVLNDQEDKNKKEERVAQLQNEI